MIHPRRIPTVAVTVAVALLSAVAVSGCGSSGDDPPEETPAGAADAAREALTSLEPSLCESLTTDRFLSTTYPGIDRDGAIKYCGLQMSDGRDDPAEKVVVLFEQADGNTSTVEVEVDGGIATGQHLTYHLALTGGKWLIDDIEGFEPSEAALRAAVPEVKKTFIEAGFSAATIECAMPEASRAYAISLIDGMRGGRFDDPSFSATVGECNQG